MNYRYRFISEKISTYLNHFPVLVLTGARQVGKTTLLSKLLQGTHTPVVFDPVIDVDNARQDPELFFKNHPGPLILDEIQYAPELVPVIKRRVDREKNPGKYILTGSQQWGVLKNVAESLAGRAVILHLSGYSLPESANTTEKRAWLAELLNTGSLNTSDSRHLHLPFPVSEHIYRGSLPGVQELPLEICSDYLDSYIATYIERDIRQLAEIADLQLFHTFFKLCGALSAQELNHSQLGRDIGVTPQTAKRWLNILKSTFQWIEVPAYAGNTIKRISGKPKGYITDTGLLSRSLFISSPRALISHPSWGSMVETLVVLDILKEISFLHSPPGVYHWRSHSGAEVDLILERDGRFFPIEIKAAGRPGKKDTRGIRAFRETYPKLDIGTGVVIHLGDSNLWVSKQDVAISYFLR